MKLLSRNKTRQRGAFLLALAALLVLGMTWMLVSAVSTASARAAAQVGQNGRVLADAKAALIAWIAMNALEATENNPGRLPCPQAWGDVGSTNEGRAAGSCSSTAIGWLPWRTLGLPVPYDAAGRQLWYVVSPGWHLVPAAGNLTINSNTPGQLTLDGRAAVALIIAPGGPLSISPNAAQTAAGCAVRNQSQALSLPATAPNPLDFLECYTGNSFTAAAVDNATNKVLNDQVVAITAADLLPALEAAIAKRIERDIVPQLQTVFAGPGWGLTAGSRLYPFAAPWPVATNPGPGPGSSNFAGEDGRYQGLLPFNQVNCTADPANPRCLPGAALTSWAAASSGYQAGGWGYIQAQSCWWEPGNAAAVCEGEYHEDDFFPANPGMRIEMQVTLRNVAMGLRAFDTARMQVEARDNATFPWLTQTVNQALTMNPDGSLTIRFWADLPNIDSMAWGTWAQYRIRIERLVVTDHALLDPTSTGAGSTGWFVRNEWFRLVYYAAAQMSTADGTLPGVGCTKDSNCLRLTTAPSTTVVWDKRALLILAGCSIASPPATRPNGTITDYLEFGNSDGGTRYEQRLISRAALFNDRVIVVDTSP